MRDAISLAAATTIVFGVVLGCDDGGDVCVADCTGRECGLEPNCGREMCGYCPPDRPICNYETGRCNAGPSTCGDGTCGAGENCATCPADCGCPAGQVCSGGVCVIVTGCGDGSCGAGENCATCPADCGCPSGQICDAGGVCRTPGACTINDDCDSVSICISGRCTLIWGRDYRFTITNGHMDTAGCFDPGCGAPDTIVVVWVDGTYLTETAEAVDTFEPVWNYSFDLRVYESTTMKVFLWDADVWPDSNDEIVETVDFNIGASWIKNGGFGPVPSDSTSYVNFGIAPR
ncbi:MAG: hypothetical protein JXB32_06205 [Deltaproteobacteria bacterium]|nr:hypothetical protein [Deltaproteobacteria bacterium]